MIFTMIMAFPQRDFTGDASDIHTLDSSTTSTTSTCKRIKFTTQYLPQLSRKRRPLPIRMTKGILRIATSPFRGLNDMINEIDTINTCVRVELNRLCEFDSNCRYPEIFDRVKGPEIEKVCEMKFNRQQELTRYCQNIAKGTPIDVSEFTLEYTE